MWQKSYWVINLPGEWMTYDKHDYLEQQAEAYKKWWERLEEIIRPAE